MVVSPVEVVPDVISHETYFNVVSFCRLMYYVNSVSCLNSTFMIYFDQNNLLSGHQPHPVQPYELQVP